MKQAKLLTALSAGLFLAACATTHEMEPAAVSSELNNITGQDGMACLEPNHIRGWMPLDETVLRVSDKSGGYYLLVTSYDCPAMEDAQGAIFQGVYGSLCGGDSDQLRIGLTRCTIGHVYTFDDQASADQAYESAVAKVK
jgi:hypothetical protein